MWVNAYDELVEGRSVGFSLQTDQSDAESAISIQGRDSGYRCGPPIVDVRDVPAGARASVPGRDR